MSRRSRALAALPDPCEEQLAQLGRNIRTARLRRRLSLRELAERMLIGVGTLRRLEGGDPRVSVGIVVSALWALGLHPQLDGLADPDRDELGKRLEAERLPKRVRGKKAAVNRDF